MPKKKVQHKGQPKQIAENPQDVEEEEYTTVVEYETNKKYCKRTIENNWAKYDSTILDAANNEDEIETPDDFSSLIKTASSDCSNFQFSSEKLWLKEDGFVPPSEIFNLDINKLSKGLACLPFYKRIGIDESELSEEDKKYFDEKVVRSIEEYKKFLGQENTEENVKELKDDDLKVDLNLVKDNASCDTENQEGEVSENQVNETEGKEKPKKIFFSENDENLEDWLDSVLDD